LIILIILGEEHNSSLSSFLYSPVMLKLCLINIRCVEDRRNPSIRARCKGNACSVLCCVAPLSNVKYQSRDGKVNCISQKAA
jgi:hypothetical protein